MSKAKPAADPVVTELRGRIKELEAELERQRDRYGDTFSQVRHLEKRAEELKNENSALHRSLRSAELARAHSEGTTQALKAFVPDVMVPRPRFTQPAPPDGMWRNAKAPEHWFEVD